MDVVILLIRVALAGVFAVAAVAKLLDLPRAQQTMRAFGVPEPLAQPAGIALPLVELAIAMLLLPVATATGGGVLALLLLLGFIGAVGVNLAQGNRPDCNCFGQLHAAPIGWTTLARNGVLAALALIAVVSGLAGDPGPSLLGWIGALDAASWLLLIGVVAIAAATAGVIWLLTHLMSQNGRLLARLDQIEAAMAAADISVAGDEDAAADEARRAPDLPLRSVNGADGAPPPVAMVAAPSPAPTVGLRSPSKPAPPVALPDLDGQTVQLTDFRGRPTAVLFWRPGCGFCQRMLTELKAWEADPPPDAPQLLIVSSEDVASNRAQGLRSPIVLDDDYRVLSAFGATGTPSAVLVDAEGHIASGVGVGAAQVFSLLRNESLPPFDAVATDGEADDDEEDDDEALPVPEIGTPAPPVTLPDLDGALVEVTARHGTPTALIFWDPDCGFCQRLLPELKQWEADPPAGAPDVVLISSGSIEANKAQDVRSLVVIDDDFTAGKAFGADGTPMAILIDGDGRVASELAEGQAEVLALLGATGMATA